MKQSNNLNNEPPLHVQAHSLYMTWVRYLEEYHAMRVSPGFDKRHQTMALEDIAELYAEAQALKLKKLDQQSSTYVNMILARPVNEHMILAQGRHQIVV